MAGSQPRTLRVLLVSDLYPPFPGGLEAHVQRLAHRLSNLGHEVAVATVAATAEDVGRGNIADGPVRVERLDLALRRVPGAFQSDRPFLPPWADRRFAKSLDDVVTSFRPDVLHAHGWSEFAAAAVSRKRNVPLVVTLHDYGLLCPTKSLFCGHAACVETAGLCCVRCTECDQGLAKRTALAVAIRNGRSSINNSVSRFLAVSSAVAREHLARGVGTDTTMTVVPNFVELASRELTPTPPDGPILYVGPDSTHKGRPVLLEAFDLLRTDRPDLRLRLVGGADAPSANGVDHVGRLSGEPLWNEFRNASVVMVPSVWMDPCPTVALEGMMFGRPVIGSGRGGMTDIVDDGVTGRVVPAADPRALAEAMHEVLADPEGLVKLGAAGAQRVRSIYGAEVVIPQIVAEYEQAAR